MLLLPWTTLMYVILWSPGGGVNGWEWILVFLAFLADVASYGRGASAYRT